MRPASHSSTATDPTVGYAYKGTFAEKERALNWSLFDQRSYDGKAKNAIFNTLGLPVTFAQTPLNNGNKPQDPDV